MAAPGTRLPVIILDHVTKNFRVGERDITILKDISLEISQGEFAAIVGSSGSGKSTLLNMITGIDRPNAGDLMVAGQQLNNLSENRLAKWRGIHIGIVFQFLQLLPSLSLGHNVILPMDFTGIRPPSERVARYGTCKAKNLAREPRCVFTVATHDLGLVFEGEAVKVVDEAKLNRIAGTYAASEWQPTVRDGALYAEYSTPSAGPPPWHVYEVTPTAEPYGETRVRIQSQ